MQVASRKRRSLIGGAATALALLTILWASLRLDARDFLQRPAVIDSGSRFQGDFDRLPDGSLVLRGDAARPSVASAEVRLQPRALYLLDIELAGSPEVRVDFYAGPEYDSDAQETVLPAGEKGGRRTRLLASGDAPERAQLRVFIREPGDLWVGSVRLYRVRTRFRLIQIALAGLALLLAGGLAVGRLGPPWLRAMALGIALFVVYRLAEPAVTDNLGDNYWYVPASLSLIQDGDLDLSEYVPYGLRSGDYRIYESGRRRHNFFPAGTSVAVVPLALLAKVFQSRPEHPLDFAARLTVLAAAAFAATAAALLYLLLCEMAGPGKALPLTVVFALATPQFTTHAGSLWSHNALLPFLLWALIALRSRRAWTAAVPLAMGVLIRPEFVVAAGVSFLYVLVFRPGQRGRFAIAAVAAGGVLAVVSLALHEWSLPPYYLPVDRLSLKQFPQALAAHLVSPNRGLFVFAPLFLGSVWGLWRGLRGGDAPYYGLLGAMAVSHWITLSLFVHWWGGHSYGPRLFSPMLPVLTVLLVPALEGIEGMRGKSRLACLLLAAALLGWSFFVQIRGVVDEGPQRWNSTPDVDLHPERIWDWRDMQILRGFGEDARSHSRPE